MSLQELPHRIGVCRLPKEVTDEIAQAVTESNLATMVYGSQARGSADEGSDVDVLTVVERSPGSYKVGRVAVTAYTPAHLHAMAQSSSLFILHLKNEGIVLDDAHGVLARALSAYVPLEDTESLWRALRAAASVLRVSDGLFATHGQAMTRLGLYLLRTALYLGAAESGHPDFDVMAAATSTGHNVVQRACMLRRASEFEHVDLLQVAQAVELVLNLDQGCVVDSAHALQNRAVQLSNISPHASALLVNVLFGNDEVDYVGLAIAPW